MKRPRSVTVLVFGVLIFTGIYWTRFSQTLARWDFLRSLPLSVPPLYLAATGLLWGLLGLLLSWGLWRGWRRAPRLLRISVLAYFGFYWFDRLALAAHDRAGGNWPFMLVITTLVVVLVYWIMSRTAVRTYFGEMDG